MGALIKHRSPDFQKQLGVLLRVNSRSLWVAGSVASFWVAMKIDFFFKRTLCSASIKGISALLKLHQGTTRKCHNTMHCLEVNIQWSSSWYIIDVSLHLLMPGIGPPHCSTQREVAAKMGVIWLRNMLWLPQFSMDTVLFICMRLSFQQRNGPVTDWAAEPAPAFMEIPFTLFGSLAKLHSHQWLRRYFYFCTSVLDLLSIFLPTSSHQKGMRLYVCVQDSFA